MCIYSHVYYFCHFPYFNNWTSPLNVLFAWFGLVWFLMSDSLFIINLIDCFFLFVLEYLFKVTSIMWTWSCQHAPPYLQCILNCCRVTMGKHSFTSTWTTFANSLCVTRKTSVFNLHNHPVPTSCHFMTAKSEESAAVHINDPSTRLAFQVGSCFCLLRFFQNHILLSAPVYTARTLRGLNPVSSVLILLTMEEQARHASLFQGLVPSWCQL